MTFKSRVFIFELTCLKRKIQRAQDRYIQSSFEHSNHKKLFKIKRINMSRSNECFEILVIIIRMLFSKSYKQDLIFNIRKQEARREFGEES